MKKLLVVLICLFGFVCVSHSEPYILNATPILDVDLSSGVIQIEVDGVVDSNNYPVKADGTISVDIQSMAPGAHVLKFRAGNPYTATNGTAFEWGVWSSVPFDLTKPLPPSTIMNPLLSESP